MELRRPLRVTGVMIAIVAFAACGSRAKDTGKGVIGKASGAAMVAAIDAAATTIEPWRCARLEPATVPPPVGWTLAGQTLRVDGGLPLAPDKRGVVARVAVVAEARGAGAATVAALDGLRRALDAESIDVVVSLGGMGADREEIVRALAPIAAGASWLVVAVPADRESITEHRAAIAELAAGGARIVDGSQIRMVEINGAGLATLPGAPSRERLGAGTAGCVHDGADVTAIVGALAAWATTNDRLRTVVLSQRAPRGGTDLAPGGIHAGDPALAGALFASVDLVIHGAVDDASPAAGKLKHAPRNVETTAPTLPVGAIDATIRYRDDGQRIPPTALILTVGEREMSWKPVAPRVIP